MRNPPRSRFGLLGAALLLLAGCPSRGLVDVDPSLPDAVQVVPVQEPGEILVDAASNPDPTPRARALHLLIAVAVEPGGGEWGARALGDPDPWVQRRGMDALAKRLPEPESARLLRDYALRTDSLSDPYVRGAAALRLAWAGQADEPLRDAMSTAWRAEDAGWRQAPLALAAAVLGDDAAIEPLTAAISRGNVALEVEFVLDLGKSGLIALVPALREGGGWVEDELRLPYSVAQVALGDPSGEGALRKALSDADPEVRLEALDYLSRMHDPTSVALLRRARDHGTDLVRWYAALALAGRHAASSDLFERAMLDGDRDVRLLAVRFAAEAASDPVGAPGRKAVRVARRVVKDGLADPDPEVRSTSLQAMATLGVDGEEDSVEAGLTDEYLDVRVEAAGTMLLLARK